MTRGLKTTLYALLIFLAGGVTGAFVAPWLGETFMRPPRPAELSHHLMLELQSRLQLTGEQAKQIQPLLKKTGEEMEAIRRETAQRVHAQMDATNKQISTLLTPEQNEKFVRLIAELHARHARQHQHPAPAPPPDR